MPRRDASPRPTSRRLTRAMRACACAALLLLLSASCGDDGAPPVNVQGTNNGTTSTNSGTSSTSSGTTSTNTGSTGTNSASTGTTTNTNSSTTGTNNSTTAPSDLERACERACARFVSCLGPLCDAAPEDPFPAQECYAGCVEDGTVDEVEAVLRLECAQLQTLACDTFEAVAEQCACEDAPDDLPQLCVDACSHAQGCLEDACGDDLNADRRACIDACLESAPLREALEEVIGRACDAIVAQACEDDPALGALCPCAPPAPLGGPCSDDAGCAPVADLAPLCLPARDPDTDAPTGYADGYCTAAGCARDADCGEEALCIPQAEGGLCFASCDARLGRQGCRAGYGCWAFDGDLGACLPQCTSDADCGGASACDPNLGACR